MNVACRKHIVIVGDGDLQSVGPAALRRYRIGSASGFIRAIRARSELWVLLEVVKGEEACLVHAFWRVNCEGVVGVRGQEDVMGRSQAFGLRDLRIVLDAGGRQFARQGPARGSRGPDRVGSAVRPGCRRGSSAQGEGLRAADRPVQGRVARGEPPTGDREKPGPSPCDAECEADAETRPRRQAPA